MAFDRDCGQLKPSNTTACETAGSLREYSISRVTTAVKHSRHMTALRHSNSTVSRRTARMHHPITHGMICDTHPPLHVSHASVTLLRLRSRVFVRAPDACGSHVDGVMWQQTSDVHSSMCSRVGTPQRRLCLEESIPILFYTMVNSQTR